MSSLTRSVIIDNVVVEDEALVFVYPSYVPHVSSTSTNLRVTDTCSLVTYFDRGYLTNGALDLDLSTAEVLNLSEESHLEFPSLLVNLEELLEALLEHWVAEAISHDVVTSCVLKASLHLEHSDLVKRGHEQVHDNSCLLASLRQRGVVGNGLLHVLGVVLLLADVEVRPDSLIQVMRHNHSWPIGYWTSN